MTRVILSLLVIGVIFALAWAIFGRTGPSSGKAPNEANGGIRVEIITDPAGASLSVDGKYYGKTPMALYAWAGQAFNYRVEVEEFGGDYKLYKPFSGSFTPTEPASISVWIERTTAEEQAAQARAAQQARDRAAAEQCRRRISQAVLIVEDWHWARTRGGGYVEAEGRVTNNTTSILRSMQAMVEYETASGQFITSDCSTIDLRDLLPGQSSPFSVLTDYNPAMARARLRFREFFGATVPTINREDAGC